MSLCGTFCKYYCLVWLSAVFLGFVPHKSSPLSLHALGSFKYFACQISDMLFYKSIDRTCDLEYLENTLYDKSFLEYRPRKVRIFSVHNATNDALAKAFAAGDGFLIKNATENRLWEFGDMDYLVENAPLNESYDVREKNWFSPASYFELKPTIEAIRDDRAQYYVAFQSKLIHHYPELKDATSDVMDDLRRKFPYLVKSGGLEIIDKFMHFAFVYAGRWWKSPLHQERAPGYFLQIRGSKQWTVVPHMHQIWMRSQLNQNPAVRFSEHFCANATSHLPVIRFLMEPGDLFYLPNFWFHQVVNLEDGPGMMLGFRPTPFTMKKFGLMTFFPWLYSREDVAHNFMFLATNLRTAIPYIINYGLPPAMKDTQDTLKGDYDQSFQTGYQEYRQRLRKEYSSLAQESCLFGDEETSRWGYPKPIIRDAYGARISL